MSTRTAIITTDVNGDFSWERTTRARVNAVEIQLGTLETPDITVIDGLYGTSILDLSGVASDVYYQPGAALVDDAGSDIAGAYGPVCVMGTLRVEVIGGGASKTGRVIFLLET